MSRSAGSTDPDAVLELSTETVVDALTGGDDTAGCSSAIVYPFSRNKNIISLSVNVSVSVGEDVMFEEKRARATDDQEKKRIYVKTMSKSNYEIVLSVCVSHTCCCVRVFTRLLHSVSRFVHSSCLLRVYVGRGFWDCERTCVFAYVCVRFVCRRNACNEF